MKGLLVKDLRLLKPQKMTLILLWVIGIFMMFTYDSASFTVGYIIFVTAMLGISTLSYDSFNNGMPFLMTFPVSRSEYVAAKYIFFIVSEAVTAGLITIVCTVINEIALHRSVFNEVAMAAGIALMAAIIFMALTYPFLFKFGVEKGRIVMAIFCGGLFAFAYVIEKIESNVNMVSSIMTFLTSIALWQIVALSILAVGLIVSISMLISMRIVKKKEY